MESDVTLSNTDWIKVVTAMHHGVQHIPDDEQSDDVDQLIDTIIDDAQLSSVDLMELESQLRR